MKKSMHTLLTAAAFAAAMGGTGVSNANAASFPQQMNIPVNAEYDPALDSPQDVYGPPEWFGQNTTTTAVTENIITNTTRTTVTVYGPPSMMSSLYAEQYGTSTTTVDTATTTMPTTTMPTTTTTMPTTTTEDILRLTTTTIMTVYGPPEVLSSLFSTTETTTADPFIHFTTTTVSPVYGPPSWLFPKGDVTFDYSVSSLDIAKMRNMLIYGTTVDMEELADVNGDGVFNIADLVATQKFVLGKESAFVSDIEDITKRTTTTAQLAYGPPIYYKATTETIAEK